MKTFILLIVLSLFLLGSSQYDWAFANTSVWLSAAAYCETNTYKTRIFKGYSTGFVVTDVIDDVSEDVQGYIGYMASQSSIYVVFRGSTSIEDWANNLDAVLTAYPRCSGCEVHAGFYKAEQANIKFIIDRVSYLKNQYPEYTVVVAGHSLGAAMATLTSLDLLAQSSVIKPTPQSPQGLRMFHFGSPRVGNTNFAQYASNTILDRHRNTHYKDMVPHVPMHERFTHISGEWYEDSSALHECSGYEDPNCAYQWHITNIDDHMHYLGLYLGCDAVSGNY